MLLRGDKVRLRAIERADLPSSVAWLNDPEVTQWLVTHRPLSLAEEERWYEDQVVRAAGGRAINFAIEYEGRYIGNCGIKEIDHRRRCAEVGIFIGAKELWNQGLGADALRLLLAYGFAELNLHRMQLDVAAPNARAIRCYEKCGLREEGRLRDDWFAHGQYCDRVVMGILEDEWRAARAK
jgi:RimJ/RimL family protein N-acetyltransferase